MNLELERLQSLDTQVVPQLCRISMESGEQLFAIAMIMERASEISLLTLRTPDLVIPEIKRPTEGHVLQSHLSVVTIRKDRIESVTYGLLKNISVSDNVLRPVQSDIERYAVKDPIGGGPGITMPVAKKSFSLGM